MVVNDRDTRVADAVVATSSAVVVVSLIISGMSDQKPFRERATDQGLTAPTIGTLLEQGLEHEQDLAMLDADNVTQLKLNIGQVNRLKKWITQINGTLYDSKSD